MESEVELVNNIAESSPNDIFSDNKNKTTTRFLKEIFAPLEKNINEFSDRYPNYLQICAKIINRL